jgi:hypothetical protein
MLLASLFVAVACNAQEEDVSEKKIYRITLKSGEVIYGRILERSSSSITIISEMFGQLAIPQKKIKELTRYNERLNKEFDEETRITSGFNFITPTAYTLRKKEYYLSSKYLFYNQVNYGITDHLQVGGGVELLSTFFGNSPTYFVSVKGNKRFKDSWKVSANVFYANGNLLRDNALIGSIVTTTYGSTKNNVSVGGGMVYHENKLQQKPIITFSVLKQITDKISFISDNFYVPFFSEDPYFSYGLRIFGEEIAIDFYFVNSKPISKLISVGFPVVGATFML